MRASAAAALCAATVLVWLCAAPSSVVAVQNILDFGAVPADTTSEAAYTNGEAINAALIAANASGATGTDRLVLVPAGNTFTFIPSLTLYGLNDVQLQIDGEIVAFQQVNLTTKTAVWPFDAAANKFHDMFNWQDCTGVSVFGAGKVDGNGYEWWWASVLKTIDDASRPHMFVVTGCRDLYYGGGLRLKNSPEYHMILTDIDTLLVEDMDIRVDVDVQRELLGAHGLLNEIGVPIFPLNTDGIDPAGKNVHIRNVSISNFDDAVAVKPSNGAFKYATCSENILVEDMKITWGLGMTIGSVPPDVNVNCVRDVTFRNIDFTLPIKAVYVKTNPGNEGTGIIQNITYDGMTAKDAVWWAIYIGPQQQKQPDGDGAGCMLYPINPDCPTQPRVPMYDITVRNFHIDGTLFSPGIVRCNSTAPCTGFVFDNVTVVHYDEFPFGVDGYKVENAYGTSTNCSPNPAFPSKFPPALPSSPSASTEAAPSSPVMEGVRVVGTKKRCAAGTVWSPRRHACVHHTATATTTEH